MLTRLRVTGFKNLDGLDVRFGPFTCIAGPNGVGKSNLLDAISFLAALADMPLLEAALSIRGCDSPRGALRSLFGQSASGSAETMSFRAEFLIPAEGEDELGQTAEASMTFLDYELELRRRADSNARAAGTLEIVREQLVHIKRSDTKKRLGFPHSAAWRDSVAQGRRTSPYISTDPNGGRTLISLHSDSAGGRGGGRPRKALAETLPRTMLSSARGAAEHRTLALARQEMTRWTQLQLEPSALRAPDGFTTPRGIGANGAHLPATLHALAEAAKRDHPGGDRDVCAGVANRLAELVENVRRIAVDVDEKQQLLSVVLTSLDDTEHFAGALSDGALRFLALAVMECDPEGPRLLGFEEPENGIHPDAIPALIRLLQDFAVDASEPVDPDNPLRQVIVTTHSPAFVAAVADDSLLVARAERGSAGPWRFSLRHLPDTWRDHHGAGESSVAPGRLLAYLDSRARLGLDEETRNPEATRVLNREDLQAELAFSDFRTEQRQ